MLLWTRGDIVLMAVLSSIPVVISKITGWTWLGIPWIPIALVGTAAAFIVGFRNTQTYNRLWEARQIYGSIVNNSRSWGMMVRDLVGSSNNRQLTPIRRQLVMRHIGWLTALRFQLREQRTWETSRSKPSNKRYALKFSIDEWDKDLASCLQPYLSAEDLAYVLSKKNRATHLIALQSKELKVLKEAGQIDPLDYVELVNLLTVLYDQQGRCERIKNFPYPRQFATISQMLTRLFVCLVPFGMLNEFQKLGDLMTWVAIPLATLIGWVFLTMERIGENTENPFEGGANDVPITALSRTIEIDLLEMLDEPVIPPAIQPKNMILT
ncbi:bestrophin family protein [Paraflavitalea speifideaquila]|uniref:bestrophin family protein n=1 Tax=Paraflavitalea speifideaquila TaxID=3076558 RepID=UPI0028EDEA37|nr:bestrophin family ion channel [Paraflavitalea speifideiaquila]